MSDETTVTTVHPHTLAELKEQLPSMRDLASMFGPIEDSPTCHAACDELRKAFPGVDDLTLAAFCTYNAMAMAVQGQVHRDMIVVSMAVSFAEMAVELAWELKGEL